MSDIKILCNGIFQRSVSALDRGLQYGDGVFETMSVIRGEIPFWTYHMRRLNRACQRLMIPMPAEEVIREEITLLNTDAEQFVVKLILSRGTSARGYRVPEATMPNRILYAYKHARLPVEYWEQGVRLHRCSIQLALQPALAGIKHLNRLEQVLATSEWDRVDAQEGLLCDMNGNVIEATARNVFMVKNGELLTPQLSSCGVEGIMREYVLELAAENALPVRITDIPAKELASMNEIFLTNSVHGVWPVSAIDGMTFTVGEITRKLRDKVTAVLPYQ